MSVSKGSKYPSFDLFSDVPPPNITAFQKEFVRDFDWSSSNLGPVGGWPPQLRQMVNVSQRDKHGSCLYWDIPATDGPPDVVVIYNEAYTHLIGQKHPALQGTDPKFGFAEVWDQFAALVERGRQNGQAVEERDSLLLLERHGFLEETYFSWKFIPIIGPCGHVVGSYATVGETTQAVLARRRLSTIQRFGSVVALCRDYQDLWSQILIGLDGNEADVPLAVLYSVVNKKSQPSSLGLTSAPSHCYLEGTLGVERGHEIAPAMIELNRDNGSRWSTTFRKAMATNDPYVVLTTQDGSLPQTALEGITWRGFGTLSSQAVLCPIRSSSSASVLGFLLVVLNPRRPFDTEYRKWIELLMTSFATPHMKALIAASTTANLSEQLLSRTRDLEAAERRFLRFATRSTVGIIVISPNGDLLFGNDAWFELVEGTVSNREEWRKIILPEDKPLVDRMWKRMLEEKVPVNYQCRFKKAWKPSRIVASDDDQRATSILVSGWPDLDADGNVSSIMATATDISEMKFIEEQLRNKTDDAEQRVKQQEAFVDMVSHEIRNPLSAILHCADEISTSLTRQMSHATAESSPDETHNMIQAADTIAYCAMHQKRIVDDILTLSKLDSNLLDVSPLPVEPVDLVETALKMFDTELKRLDMQLHLEVDQSMRELKINWLLFDSSRFLQVLINLMTNAVKFTRDSQDQRDITVTVSATLNPPPDVNGVTYVPSMDRKMSPSHVWDDWPLEDIVWLSCSVEDTGKGITAKELKTLFLRFSQASPKTQVQYGGSGLGLYISRQLSEMQGGKIGVKSEVGKGTTFTFYVKTCRTIRPQNPDVQIQIPDFNRVKEELPNACGSGTGLFEINEPSASRLEHLTISDGVKSVDNSTDELDGQPIDNFHVLIVEDNIVNQKVLAKQLRNHNCTVHVANHGQEALLFIENTKYWTSKSGGDELSVVLMDLEMPIMDGLTCVRRIRGMEESGVISGHVPVIAVTANARSQQIKIATEAGMDDVVTKPYRISEILTQISSVIGRLKKTGQT